LKRKEERRQWYHRLLAYPGRVPQESCPLSCPPTWKRR
jgi:hypothetical protein